MAFSRASPATISTSFSRQLRSSSLSPITFSRFGFSCQKSLPLVLPSLAFETLVKSVSAKGENNKERSEDGVNEKVWQFTDSVSFEADELWRYDIDVRMVHANMLAFQELITRPDKDLIIEGLLKIQEKIKSGEFVWRKDRQDVHMNIEAALTDMIGEPAKKLLIGRSRNEHVAAVLIPWCCHAIDRVLNLTTQLQVQLMSLAQRNHGLIIRPDNTYLRSDMPVQSDVELLEQDVGRLINCKIRSQELVSIAPLSNRIDAVTARDFVFDLLFANYFIALDLFQICEKWVFFSNPKESWRKLTEDIVDIRSLKDSYSRLPSAVEPYLISSGREEPVIQQC